VDFITAERTQVMNITERIGEIVRRSGISDGLVHLQSLHTTTAGDRRVAGRAAG